MTVKPLTKEQHMEILSKSYDAGAHIDIYFHKPEAGGTTSPEKAKSILEIMQPDRSDEKFARFHCGEDSRLRAVIVLPEETPPDWQDTGDMEEANA